MAILKIVHYGDPILHKKGKNVSSFDSSLASLGKDMIETMHHAEGIGLAAQQIGKELQFCVVDLREAEAEFTYTYDRKICPACGAIYLTQKSLDEQTIVEKYKNSFIKSLNELHQLKITANGSAIDNSVPDGIDNDEKTNLEFRRNRKLDGPRARLCTRPQGSSRSPVS